MSRLADLPSPSLDEDEEGETTDDNDERRSFNYNTINTILPLSSP